jgi:hypothetical protein
MRSVGNAGKLDFNLNAYTNRLDMFHAIDAVQYLGENTNTTGGLKVARTQVFGANYDQRPAADRIIILITDGVPTRDVDLLPGEVQTILAMGIRIVGLGVTNQVSRVPSRLLLAFYCFELSRR